MKYRLAWDSNSCGKSYVTEDGDYLVYTDSDGFGYNGYTMSCGEGGFVLALKK